MGVRFRFFSFGKKLNKDVLNDNDIMNYTMVKFYLQINWDISFHFISKELIMVT